MKKQLKTLTDIAAVAAVTLVLALALLPAEAEELSSEVTEESKSTPEESNDPVTVDPASQTTTNPPLEAIVVTETTTGETQPTTTPAPATTTTTQPPQTTTQPPQQPTWTEQETSGVKYVNTDGISSVEVAQIGSKKMKQYSLNDAVTVVAITDTDYYKLEDGTFIHADFLSDSQIVITTTEEETQPPDTEADTEAEEDTDIETEPDEDSEDAPDVIVMAAQISIQSKALEMFNMVNEYRSQCGLSALQWDYNAYPAAQIRAMELLQRNSHTRPDGTRFSTVYGEIGYSPSANGENIVYYYSDPRSALTSLINSASHRELILSTDFTHISIAYIYDPNSYWGYYWVQEFTTP